MAAAVVIMAVSAGGTFLAQAGTALAPEPAHLTAALDLGATTAAAYYVSSNQQTTVFKWPATYTAGTVPAGTPCSPVDLAAGQETARVIQATGNYRKCI